jgi:hypothetical protein
MGSISRIRFRAKKELGRTESYHPIVGTNMPPYLKKSPAPCGADEIIGIYENVPSELDQCIVISEQGLIVYTGATFRAIKYRDIATFTTANSGGLAPSILDDMLVIELVDGDTVEVPVRNDTERFRDIFSFSAFLDAVLRAIRYFDNRSQ